MAPPPPPRDPEIAVLIDDLVEEFLLRLPPEDPADLACASLVNKQWHRVVTGGVFRRRYREFHPSAPLLGYFANLTDFIRFVSMSSSFRPPHADRRYVEAVHSSHGRILLLSNRELKDFHFSVWDPITDKEWELPVLVSSIGTDSHISNWEAAVVCTVGDGCNHLDCHFKVVVVGISARGAFSCFYSSEADSWSDRIFVSGEGGNFMMGSVLVENCLYFKKASPIYTEAIIAKYDLSTNQMCTISLQCDVDLGMHGHLIAAADARLGFAMTSNSKISLWSRDQESVAKSRVIQLQAILPDDAPRDPLLQPETWVDKPWVAAFADTVGGVIFLRTCVGYFTIDLDSGRSKKVGEYIVLYMSFCTPVSGTVSTYEGSAASVVVSAESGASVAVTTDEEPGPNISST